MRLTYEITGETRAVHGVILNRIRALPGNRFAAPGTLGGWVEREENLEDGAWIADEACVYGNAILQGNVVVRDSARVYGTAWLNGETCCPIIIGSDCVIHGGYWTEEPFFRRVTDVCSVNVSSNNSLRIGCKDYTFERWVRNLPAILRLYVKEDIFNEVNTETVEKCVQCFNDACESCFILISN